MQELKNYNIIYIISPNKHFNDYATFLNKLQFNNIIDENKNWKCKNTCIIYNCPSLQKDKNNNIENLNKIINRYNKLKFNESRYNNKIILLYHDYNGEIIQPIKINDVYIVHNSYIKDLLKNSDGVINNASLSNLKGYVDKFINYAILKHNINPNISKVRDNNKLNNIVHLNKLAIVYDYLNGDKITNIDVNDYNKSYDTLKILSGNQFIQL